MKYILFIFLVTLSSTGLSQSREAELTQILEDVITRSQESSYYTDSVDWDLLSVAMREETKGAKELKDLKPAFELLLNKLRDHHGHFRETTNYSIIAGFTDHENSRNLDERVFAPETWSLVNDLESRFEYEILPENIGYLKVVGVGQNVDGQAEAERIRAAISELNDKHVDKWIIDLRYNGGGNINIMLAGLAPLLDTGIVASIRDLNDEVIGNAEIRNNEFWYMGQTAFEVKNNIKLNSPQIAVLTSRWTVSSGELVAVAFKEQSNTKFFGEATGGYTTNTGWEVLNEEVAMIIATGVYCDRNGNIYADNVKPDAEIIFEIEEDKKNDNCIIAATKWLKQK